MTNKTFQEVGTFTFEDKQFTSGGAAMWQGKDGKLRGVLYDYLKEHSVGLWDGSKKVRCQYGKMYRSNFGDRRQVVYFEWDGVTFWGWRSLDNSDIVYCYEMKRTYEGTLYSGWSREELQQYFDQLYTLKVEMAYSGMHKGHECITQAFYQWRKGTPRVTIEEWFMAWLSRK